jgi:hypothetical protein
MVEESPHYERALVLGILSMLPPRLFFPHHGILFSPVGSDRGNLSRLLLQA